MSQQLEARLARISKYSNIPSYAREIEFIENQISGAVESGEFVEEVREDLEILEQQVESAISDLPREFKSNHSVTMYIDAINGSDENDGMTEQTAFKTLEKYFSTFTPSRPNQCRIYSDLEFSGDLNLAYKGMKILFLGVGARHEIKFVEDGKIRFNGSSEMLFSNIKVTNSRSNALAAFQSNLGEVNAVFSNCQLSQAQSAIDSGSNLFSGRTYIVMRSTIVEDEMRGFIHSNADANDNTFRPAIGSSEATL